jgi:hypothetical protein
MSSINFNNDIQESFNENVKDEEIPKKTEEINSKFSVFLKKKEKVTTYGDGLNVENEQNENIENASSNMYGRSYLKKIKASSQRKYIKDEKYPSSILPKAPLPDSIRTKQNLYTDFKKKTKFLEKEHDNEDIIQEQITKDIVKKFAGREREREPESYFDQSVNEFAFSLRNKNTKSKHDGKITNLIIIKKIS